MCLSSKDDLCAIVNDLTIQIKTTRRYEGFCILGVRIPTDKMSDYIRLKEFVTDHILPDRSPSVIYRHFLGYLSYKKRGRLKNFILKDRDVRKNSQKS